MAAETSPNRIFFSAGEASGDAYAVELLRELRKLVPVTAEGIGGVKSAQEGIDIVADSSRWGAIGIAEAVRTSPRVIFGYFRAKRALTKGKPGLFIAIDFGYVNIRLCRQAKKYGWKVIYFVPPGSWKRGPQGRDLPILTDLVITPTSWSFDQLQRIGVNVRWFGHPLKQLLARDSDSNRDAGRIALVLGSRDAEVGLLRSVMRDLVAAKTMEGYLYEFPVAPNVNLEALRSWWIQQTGRQQDVFHRAGTAVSFRRCHVAVVCSGTATLEAALCGCPIVVVYKVRKITWIEGKLLRIRPKFIALPNLILDRAIVPELIQDRATADAIRGELLPLLSGEARSAQVQAFGSIGIALGGSDAITRTAAEVASMLQ